MHSKQVSKDHYEFRRYLSKQRWASVWHQIDEVYALQPTSVLEIGPGPGAFKAMANSLGLTVHTLDLDADLKPDYIGHADSLPFPPNSYDAVCAFQVLEHLPYEQGLAAFKEMARVARNGVVISLPDARRVWPYSIYLPRCGELRFLLPHPFHRTLAHTFDGEHHWELNKKGFALDKVRKDLCRAGGLVLVKTFRVHEFGYHRFFTFSKQSRAVR